VNQGPALQIAWLHNIGFSLGHPFTTREASDEPASALVQYFVLRPGFADVLGRARQPQSALLHARRGAGKTTSRLALTLQCQAGQMDAPVLPVTYVDFERPLVTAGVPAKITLDQHIDELLRLGLAALFDALADRPQRATSFVGGVRRQLAHYLRRYTSLLDDIGLDMWLARHRLLSETCQAETLRLGQVPADAPFLTFVAGLLAVSDTPAMPVAPIANFASFLALAQQAGFEAVYVLIDRVDERQPMAADHAQAAALLAPLVSDIALMDLEGVAFKFFIPTAVLRALATQLGDAFRPGRLVIRDISWDEAALKELLDRRVSVFSEGVLPSLDAAAETPIVTRLAAAAGGSPRNLLRLAEWMLYWQHRRAGPSGALWLTAQDAERAIASFNEEREAYLVAPEPSPTARRAAAEAMIRIDEASEVWVGARCVGHLAAKRRRLLAYMLENEGRELSYDQIGTRVHGDDWTLRGMTSASIDGLAKHLRRELGLGAAGERIIRKVPGGGYLFRQPQQSDFT